VSRFIAMRKRQELKTQRKRKHKTHVARTPQAVAKYKACFLKLLALGLSPGVAARNLKIARSTAYGWKKEDQEFDTAWVDAVETGLDALETQLYDSGLAGNSSAAQFILKHRRFRNIGDGRPQQSNFISEITLQEHYKRLERLGLPVPMIEGDYEEGPADANHSSRKPEDVAKYKERFLKQLALGRSPGVAARNVKIARSTAYGWKKEDQEFDTAWRDAEDVAKYKERFLKQLALGRSPGVAARNVGIARSTAYGWKKEDQEFDAAWVDAVETALDRLEQQLYDSALAGNSSDAQFILKHRRREVYGNVDHRPQQSKFISNITLQEHYKRLERLGLPLPVIESDREEDYAPGPTNANHQ
jgi:hypothetical protein